jgi:chemotaxis protein CheC
LHLIEKQIDAIKELINIGVGRAAGILSEMINRQIALHVPSVKMLSRNNLSQEIAQIGSGCLSAVKLGFRGSFTGTAALVFPPDSASALVSLLLSEDSNNDPSSADLDSIRVGTLNEVGNIVISGIMGSIANVLQQRIDYSIPAYTEDSFENMIVSDRYLYNITTLLAHAHFTVEQSMIEGNIILIFEAESFGALLKAINSELA